MGKFEEGGGGEGDRGRGGDKGDKGTIFFYSQCPMPNAPCAMPNAQCPMPDAQLSILMINATE
ncbi:hypothetical protein [Tolypothrix sp. VBCCA 56010]|uniref:hypothetical protein n=1 Tax=Tolypothrix sp. VBCCA 56010 TaxID=3137731 RepID=UPI003D7DAD8B